jgi:HEAT repeat protein
LIDDHDVGVSAMIALGKLKAHTARPLVERFLAHPDSWVRQEAKKALARIDR